MKTYRCFPVSALALVMMLALAAPALAYPGQGCQEGMGLSAEQMLDVQRLYRQHREAMAPLLQRHFAKLAEMDHLLAAGVKPNDGKMEAARKELRDIDAQLYEAEAALLRQLSEKGVPYAGCHGMRGGMGCGPHGGFGPGMGRGRHGGFGPGMGHGMGMGFGGCPGY